MRQKGNAPCKGCSERQIGCHGRCEKYGAWVERYKIKRSRWPFEGEITSYEAARSIKGRKRK